MLSDLEKRVSDLGFDYDQIWISNEGSVVFVNTPVREYVCYYMNIVDLMDDLAVHDYSDRSIIFSLEDYLLHICGKFSERIFEYY